jgi:hypothetical protein
MQRPRDVVFIITFENLPFALASCKPQFISNVCTHQQKNNNSGGTQGDEKGEGEKMSRMIIRMRCSAVDSRHGTQVNRS